MNIPTPDSPTLRERCLVALFTATLVMAAGVVPGSAQAARKGPKNPEDLLIVDCLLPGQVRKLGSQATFMSARRPVRTTQADCEIRGGEYVAYDRANYQTALQVWMAEALAGNAEAQNYVGEIYLKGLGIPPDHGMAAQWFQKAAAQGLARAKTNLAYLYEEGLGVPRDELKALNLYREAAGASDELLFASVVKVQLEAKDTEIASLRQTVEEQRRQTEQLRARIRELESELDRRRRAAASAESELRKLEQQLAEARRSVGGDFSDLDARKRELTRQGEELLALTRELEAERASLQRRKEQLAQQEKALQARRAEGAKDAFATEVLEEQTQTLAASIEKSERRSAELEARLASLQQALEAQRKDYEARIAALEAKAARRNQEDWELMKLLENQLAAREAELREQQMQIVALEQKVAMNGGVLLAAAPTLEIIDPPLVLTRGRAAAQLRGGPGRHAVVGRVSAPQAVQQVTVNGTPVILGDSGLFRASVEVAPQGVPVRVDAVGRTGEVASVEFTLLPAAVAAGPADARAGQGAGALPPGIELGRFHALVVGNNSYQSPAFGTLRSAVNDATAVANLLRDRYGYQTRLLLNASRYDMLAALNDLRQSLGPKDNLLIYYAGHGELSEDGNTGYWIPVDGQPGLPNTWISNRAVSDILDAMQARHVLVVADSCYSGALADAALPLFAGAGERDQWERWVKTMVEGRSRIALTSGGLQPVPDSGTGKHSYFARAFLNVLEDNNRLLEGQGVFRSITSTLALTSLDAPLVQSPVYAPIQFAGHVTGDFFFLPKGTVAGP
ncbi:MAG: hypothetical protein KatS3mg126_1413 [Lysobacteraceae bacterium]|nr:MAG: hypothetical protein KatS3mg126_1413 [Xanthomonadaceae bacterium]